MKSILKLTLLSIIFSSVFCVEVPEGAPEVTEEDNVLVLTEKNFDYVVTNNKHVLVEFYAPWCGHCKALAPEYAKAASTLKAEDFKVKLGKVDATFETALGSKYEVKGYPTLKLFKDGNTIEYQGGRQAPDIINWLKKKTGPPCKILNDDEEVKNFKASNEVVVVGHFTGSESVEAKNYEAAVNQIDDVPFGIIFNAQVANTAEINLNSVVVFKQIGSGKTEKIESKLTNKELLPWIIRETSPLVQEMSEEFDEGRLDYEGDLSDDSALATFVAENQMRLVTEFTPESAPKIFGGEISIHNILFVSKTSPDFDKHLNAFKQAAVEFKGNILFIYIDSDVEDNKRVMEFFGITVADIPDVRIVKMSENMAKFKPEKKDLSADGIAQFAKDVQSGKLKRHLMSEEIPNDWNKNPVAILVGKNFKEIAFDQSKKVFVQFYAPWCNHCKSLKPTWDKLGEAFRGDDNIIIATMDSTVNDVTDFEVGGFPTLKFFPSGSDKILDYNGDRSVEAMVEYVKSNGEKVSGGEGEEEEVDQVKLPSEPLPPKEIVPPSDHHDTPAASPGAPSQIDIDEEIKKFKNMDTKDYDAKLNPEHLVEELEEDYDDELPDEADMEGGATRDEL